MQQLAKSIGSFTWAVSLFGLQQMAGALRSTTSGKTESQSTTQALDAVTRASLEQCGNSLRETFEMGDKMQRDVVDMMFRVVPLGGGEKSDSWCSSCTDPMEMFRKAAGMARSATMPTQNSMAPEEEMGWGPVTPVP